MSEPNEGDLPDEALSPFEAPAGNPPLLKPRIPRSRRPQEMMDGAYCGLAIQRVEEVWEWPARLVATGETFAEVAARRRIERAACTHAPTAEMEG